MKKQTLLYSLFHKLVLERIELPSMFKIDSEVSKWLYEVLCSKAEKKVKIIEERYQKRENEETVMPEIQKLEEEKDRLVASQCEMFEKKSWSRRCSGLDFTKSMGSGCRHWGAYIIARKIIILQLVI